MGCLAPLVVISLPIKHIRNSLHSSFGNNSSPFFPLITERKISREGPAEAHGVSSTTCSYLITNDLKLSDTSRSSTLSKCVPPRSSTQGSARRCGGLARANVRHPSGVSCCTNSVTECSTSAICRLPLVDRQRKGRTRSVGRQPTSVRSPTRVSRRPT